MAHRRDLVWSASWADSPPLAGSPRRAWATLVLSLVAVGIVLSTSTPEPAPPDSSSGLPAGFPSVQAERLGERFWWPARLGGAPAAGPPEPPEHAGTGSGAHLVGRA